MEDMYYVKRNPELIDRKVIEDIKSEIAEYKDDKIIHAEQNEMIDIVLEIIDKYTASIEPQESEDENVCEKCLYVEETDGSHCYECVKGKSKYKAESEDKDEHFMPIQSLTCDDINDIIDES